MILNFKSNIEQKNYQVVNNNNFLITFKLISITIIFYYIINIKNNQEIIYIRFKYII